MSLQEIGEVRYQNSQGLNVIVDVSDDRSGLQSVKLDYRQTGQADFTEVDMNGFQNGSQATYNISGGQLTAQPSSVILTAVVDDQRISLIAGSADNNISLPATGDS